MDKADIAYMSEFLKEFQEETDRGAALVGAALLDQQLLKILKVIFLTRRNVLTYLKVVRHHLEPSVPESKLATAWD